MYIKDGNQISSKNDYKFIPNSSGALILKIKKEKVQL